MNAKKTLERLKLLDAKHELENDLYKIRSQIIEMIQGLYELPIEVLEALFDVDDYGGFIEAVEKEYLQPDPSPPDDQEQALEQALGPARNAMRQKLEKIEEINKSLAKPDAKKEPKPNATKGGPKPIVWLKKDRAFGDWILKAFRQNQFSATSKINALEQAVKHFVREDGETFKPRSILQSLKNREVEGKGGPGEPKD